MTKLTLLSLTVAGVGLTACGPGEKEGEAQPIEHTTARQAIVGNSQEMAARVSTNIKFIESSRLFSDAIQLTVEDELEPCSDFDTPCSDPEPAEFELDTDINDDVDQMLAELEARVLNDASVEAQTETSITYLVDGELACEQDGTSDPECVSEVDAMEIRLVVTSPSEGNVDIDLLVGPNRAHPITLNVHQLMLGATVDLGGLKGAAEHAASVTGDDIDLPTTFEGKVSARLEAQGSDVLKLATSVDQTVKVAGGDFSVALASTPTLFALTADAAAKTLVADADMGTLDVNAPVSTYTYDFENDIEIEESYALGLHIGGANGSIELNADTDVVTATGLGLGDETTTLALDGSQVLALDVNANDGRRFDATIAADGDATTVEVSPAFDLRAALSFALAPESYGESEEWMLDDVLHVRLDGAAAPKVRLGDQIEVLAGQLLMELENAGDSMIVGEGQCVLDVEVDASGTGDEPTEPIDASLFADVEVGTCQ